jgi:hypothetical protein
MGLRGRTSSQAIFFCALTVPACVAKASRCCFSVRVRRSLNAACVARSTAVPASDRLSSNASTWNSIFPASTYLDNAKQPSKGARMCCTGGCDLRLTVDALSATNFEEPQYKCCRRWRAVGEAHRTRIRREVVCTTHRLVPCVTDEQRRHARLQWTYPPAISSCRICIVFSKSSAPLVSTSILTAGSSTSIPACSACCSTRPPSSMSPSAQAHLIS